MTELTNLDRFSYQMSIILLAVAFPLNVHLLYRIWSERAGLHVLHWSMAWLLVADLLMVFNYVPHHAISLTRNEMVEGPYCSVSGFVSLIAVCFANEIAAAMAVVTDRSMGLQSRPFSRRFRSNYWKYTVIMMMPPILYASILAATGQVGNYRNLYCCMKDPGNPAVFWTTCLVFATCASVQAYYYYQSYYYVKDQMGMKSANLSTTGGSATQDEAKTRFVAGIRDHAIKMCVLFYAAWFPMLVNGLVAFTHNGMVKGDGKEYTKGADVFAVLMVKLMPLFNCLMIWRSVSKAVSNKRNDEVVRAQNGQHTYRSHSNTAEDKQNAQSSKGPAGVFPGVKKLSNTDEEGHTKETSDVGSSIIVKEINYTIESDADEQIRTSYAVIADNTVVDGMSPAQSVRSSDERLSAIATPMGGIRSLSNTPRETELLSSPRPSFPLLEETSSPRPSFPLLEQMGDMKDQAKYDKLLLSAQRLSTGLAQLSDSAQRLSTEHRTTVVSGNNVTINTAVQVNENIVKITTPKGTVLSGLANSQTPRTQAIANTAQRLSAQHGVSDMTDLDDADDDDDNDEHDAELGSVK